LRLLYVTHVGYDVEVSNDLLVVGEEFIINHSEAVMVCIIALKEILELKKLALNIKL